MRHRKAPVVDEVRAGRFWSLVSMAGESDCWLWSGVRMGASGHGGFCISGESHYAHRIAFLLSTGSWPGDYCVLHNCDVPLCVNPGHLRLGTQAENIADRVRRGRSRGLTGEASRSSKLTADQVTTLRARAAAGEKLLDLAMEFGIANTTAWLIATRRTWKHL